MIVQIDFNNDKIIIADEHPTNPNEVINISTFDLERPYYTLKILEEIFNRIDFHGAHETINITLTKIDEDSRTIVGEW